VALNAKALAPNVRRVLEGRGRVTLGGLVGDRAIGAGRFEQQGLFAAISRSATAGKVSMSTAIRATASSATAALSATTMAIGSPT
jgi:hypothetical protein